MAAVEPVVGAPWSSVPLAALEGVPTRAGGVLTRATSARSTPKILAGASEAKPAADPAGASSTQALEVVSSLMQAVARQSAHVDAAWAQGAQLDERAMALEAQADALRANLDPLEVARLQAEDEIQVQRGAVEAARGEVERAQAELLAAQQAMAQAGGIKKKKKRRRAQAAAQQQIDAATFKLNLAQPRLNALTQQLEHLAAQAQTLQAPFERAQSQWQQAQTLAQAARAQASSHAQSVRDEVQQESALKSELVQALARHVQAQQRRVQLLESEAAAGRLSAATLAAEKLRLESEQHNLNTWIQTWAARSSDDHATVLTEREQAVALQVERVSRQSAAKYFSDEQEFVQPAYMALDQEVQARQAEFDQRQHQWLEAQTAYFVADAQMDRAERRVNAKKQQKAMAAAQPPLEAAREQRELSLNALNQAQRALDAARSQAAPLRHEWVRVKIQAERAAQAALTHPQADAQSARTELARLREQGSVDVLWAVQTLATQGLRAQGALHDMQGQRVQADRLIDAADAHEQQARAARTALQRLEQSARTHDELAIEAGSALRWVEFLQGQVREVGARQTQTQSDVTAQTQAFVAALAQAGGQAQSLENLRAQAASVEQGVALRFALERMGKAAPAQGAESPNDFLQRWLQTEMQRRPTVRKQLHLLDDLEQTKSADASVAQAREALRGGIEVTEQSAQHALALGHGVRGLAQVFALRAEWMQHTQGELTLALDRAQDTPALADAQTQVLHEAVRGASGDLSDFGLSAWAAADFQHAQGQAQGGARVQEPAQSMDEVPAPLEYDAQAVNAGLDAAKQLQDWTQALERAQEMQTQYALDTHERRVRYDQTYRKQKKKALVKKILSTTVGVALAALSMGSAITLGTLLAGSELGAVGLMAAGATGSAAGNAATQGFNLAIGAQEEFVPGKVGIAALGAAATMGLLAGPASLVRDGIRNGLGASSTLTRWVGAPTLGYVAEGLTAAGVANPAVQGGLMAMGLQDKFDWGQSVAVGLVAGGISALNGRAGARSASHYVDGPGGQAAPNLSWAAFRGLGTQNVLHELGGRAFADVFANLNAAYLLNDRDKQYPHQYV